MEYCCSYFLVSLWKLPCEVMYFCSLDGFFHAEIVFFEESVLWNTLLSVNVDQCECVFGISWFSNFNRPSSVLRWKFGRFNELFKHFHAGPG
jgi:hypothetical protein